MFKLYIIIVLFGAPVGLEGEYPTEYETRAECQQHISEEVGKVYAGLNEENVAAMVRGECRPIISTPQGTAI